MPSPDATRGYGERIYHRFAHRQTVRSAVKQAYATVFRKIDCKFQNEVCKFQNEVQ